MVFNAYAKYYDAFYNDKDYKEEVLYVHDLINSCSKNSTTILDMGCGTGKHANEFSKLGYSVTGVDISEQMISRAKENFPAIDFETGDLRTVRLNKKFDVVVGLFHVMSYQTTDQDILDAFNTAYHHLRPGGIFIFDCWHGLGVLSDPPTERKKSIINKEVAIERKATPQHNRAKKIIKVSYEISVKENRTDTEHSISEEHHMRYFIEEEISKFADDSKFKMLAFNQWLMDNTVPVKDCWNVVAVLKKQ